MENKKQINDILIAMQNGNIDIGEAANKLEQIIISCRIKNKEYIFTKNEVDFIYCIGILNTLGIDGLQKELNRLKTFNVTPSDMMLNFRKS